jgi:hypothetical protein
MVSSLVIRINLTDIYIYIYILLSSHNTIIIKTGNVRFIENNEVEGSETPCNIKIQEVRVHILYFLNLLKLLFLKFLNNLIITKNNK